MGTDDCRRTVAQLASFVDNALSAADRAGVERHLAGCTACRHAAELQQGGRTVLRRCAGTLRKSSVPPALQARCSALAYAGSAGQAPASPFWRVRLVPLALAAALIVFSATAILSLATERSNGVLATQLAADHVKCFRLLGASVHLGSTSHEIEHALANRYGWDAQVPPSSAADGVELLGARHCLYADGLVPHVMYRVEGQDVSLYMLNGVARDGADLVTLGQRSRIWSRGENTYVLVSPSAAGDLGRAVRYVMREAQ